MEYIYIFGKPYAWDLFDGFPENVIVYALNYEVEYYKSFYSGTILPIDPYILDVTDIKMASITIQLNKNEESPLKENCNLSRIECYDSYSGTTTLFSKISDNQYKADNLCPGNYHDIKLLYTTLDGETIELIQSGVETIPCNINIECLDKNQVALKFMVKAEEGDESVVLGKNVGVCVNGQDYSCSNGIVEITNLIPGRTYYVYPYAFYNNQKVYGDSKSFTTLEIEADTKNNMACPTTYTCNGAYTLGTASLKSEYFIFDNVKYEGNSLLLCGLEPNTPYDLIYTVICKEGEVKATKRISFTTPALELTTLQPKGVSERCSIVAATTNISEEETNVGFQWKKYDAPASLAPSEGYAAIYNGQIEGYIRNLQPTSYYNVRAFYKSNDGIYYYGDWVTFDPSDFSYFEPTVHTYEATDVTARSAKVKGYVLAGTDNIIEQGFEYWAAGALQSKAMRVPAAVANDVTTVLSTGQVMTATLTNLQPNTTYHFRSFVKTASGTTYGEEQILTTDYDTTGIGSVEASSAEPVVVGYYDLNGRRLEGIGKGITILRYSDGSTRKVVRK